MVRYLNSVLVQFAILVNVYSVFGIDCGPNNGKLQVHMVPHSHDDVGWLKTVDQYYYGANRTIQDAAVQYTIDTVVMSLQKNPNRTFIYVEMAFFKRWWDEQNTKTKDIVRRLVRTKQLEFINGGWSMNDEAATHYNAIIDQMTVGLRFINDTFGSEARPTVAWHIDPFGHSAEQASLFSSMSFNGFFLGRIDHADKDKRKREKRMEMVWRGSRNLGESTQIFTGVLYNRYSSPPGFCYAEQCHDPPIQDNPRLYDMNVKERVDAFVKYTCEQAQHFITNHIVLTMGDDFMYQNAHRWYKNMDKLIRYVNKDGRVHAFYSTPSRYLKALQDSKKTWEVKTDDFFPYSHCPHCYWTGYFTSRPTLKRYIRESNNILQACKQVEVVRGNVGNKISSDFLRRSMAVNQHHDAVTGTSKQHVAYDYEKRLHMGRTDCQAVMNSFIKHKYGRGEQRSTSLDFQRCDYLNISVCRITETKDSIVLNVYNPIGRRVNNYIRVPVNTKKLIVLDALGNPALSQILPVSKPTSQLRNNHKGYAAYELITPVTLPPLGFSTLFLNRSSSTKKVNKYAPISSTKIYLSESDNFIENEFLKMEFSVRTGRLVKILDKKNKLDVNIDQNFLLYEGSTGNNQSRQTSGAYIFRPIKNDPIPISKYGRIKTTITRGPLVSEARQIFGPFVSQVIRLYRGMNYAEFEHTIGPIPVGDKIGKEVITRFKTDIANNGIFYTDANGREIKKRKRDYRETWKLNSTEPVSQNYYPINSRIFINDSSTQLTIMTDRSQGGGSINDGELEIMLHRRLLKDDFLGVGEPLNETGVSGKGLVTRGKHLLFLSRPAKSPRIHRQLGQLMMMEPMLSFSNNPYTLTEWKEKFFPLYSALTRPLPKNLHLLTMETTRRKDEIILRLEHIFEKDEDPTYSKPVTVNLENLFNDFNVLTIEELNLSANQFLKDKKMWKWKTKKTEVVTDKRKSDINLEVTLHPMEIRTFLLEIKYY